MENLQEAVELHFEEDIERGEKIIVMTLSELRCPELSKLPVVSGEKLIKLLKKL